MAGLFEKDMRLIFKRKQTLVIFIAIAVMMGFNTDGTFVIGYLTCLCTIFTISTISYDEMDNGYPFLLTLPIDHKTYVLEKFGFCGIVGLGSWAIGLALLFIINLVKGISVNPMEEIINSVMILPVFLIIGAIMIPLQLKFGIEKSRLALVVVYGGVIALVMTGQTLMNKTDMNLPIAETVAKLEQMSAGVMILIVFVIAAVLTAISVKYSISIMNKKEY